MVHLNDLDRKDKLMDFLARMLGGAIGFMIINFVSYLWLFFNFVFGFGYSGKELESGIAIIAAVNGIWLFECWRGFQNRPKSNTEKQEKLEIEQSFRDASN